MVEAGALKTGQDLVLVAAAALSTGGDTTVAVEPGPPSVLVFADRLTPAKLAAMANELGVSRLRALDGAVGGASEGQLSLTLTNGEQARLEWDPEQPGRTMLQAVLPWFAAAAALLALFVALVFRHAAKAAAIISSSASELVVAHERAEHQARHDLTTGLPNRLSLTAYMDEALSTAGARLVVIYADLDRFKPINDALGHPAGDHVLTVVSSRLRGSLRDGDLVARVGGDEFVIVVPSLAEHDVETLCKRLLRDVSAPIAWEGSEVHVGLSMGIALSPTDATSTHELIRRADLALYQAKNDGRGTYRFFAHEMNERIVLRRGLETDLRRGIAEGEFVLHYQPRYDTREMTMLSAEALIRWHHPRRGMISPAEFIPLAEETGLIVPLGEWILRSACSTIGPFDGIGVSVNVSPAQFRDGELVATVKRVLSETARCPRTART